MKTAISIIGIVFLVVLLKTPSACSTTKRSKPCTQCPQYAEQLERVESFIYEIQAKDSIINHMNNAYTELLSENQLFSSMLSEIENEPGGSEILHTIYNNKK